MLKMIPLGGLGEIGLNTMVLEYGEDTLILDAGLMFPEEYMPGVDVVIPDFQYLKDQKQRIKAVILTHGHEDHLGAMPFFLKEFNVPVYGTRFTVELLKEKLKEHNLLHSAVLHKVKPGEVGQFGPFRVEYIRVNHSIVDGIGLAIETPEGILVHSGDFKIDQTPVDGQVTDMGRFAYYGERGVLALFSDSTNVEKEGRSVSDSQVGGTLEKIVAASSGRVIIALFASNIARIQQIISICGRLGRKAVFNGRSIELSAGIASELKLLDIPADLVIDVSEIDDYAPEEILILTTGSQGEPMSVLARMSAGTHKQLKVEQGDRVILSSKFIPGNEKAIAKIINNLFRRGADVVYETISEIHVSGHAFREELRVMIALTRPRYFVPIHGEYRHLVHHANLAEACGIPRERVLLAENGQVLKFDASGGRVSGSVDVGRILVDGKGIGDVGRSVLKERRLLSEEGLVVVTLAIDAETGFVVYGPEIVSKGLVFETETGHIIDDAQCVLLEIIEEVALLAPSRRADVLRQKMHRALREYFTFTLKRRPVILPFILEL